MKRYYFNVRNAEGAIINKIDVVANNLETAWDKVKFKVNLTYQKLACFVNITFNYHEAIRQRTPQK